MCPEPTMSARLVGIQVKAAGLKGQYGQHRKDCVKRSSTVESLKTAGEIGVKTRAEGGHNPRPLQ